MTLVDLKSVFCRRFTNLVICNKSNYSGFRGRTFRYLNLNEVGPDALEGMKLLEERRLLKYKKELEEREQRRAKGIMYDEVIKFILNFINC
jgi:hypothetical protein